MRLVQLARGAQRRVGFVDGSTLRLLPQEIGSIYALAKQALESRRPLVDVVTSAGATDALDYDQLHRGESEWRFLPSFDHPEDPAHCLVSGTGLTHNASARNRAAMHTATAAELTDSHRMFQMGLAGGKPAPGQIGVQPEWFYKGNGTLLKAHLEPIDVPPYALDGGEEPEIAGAYVISRDGEPVRVGLTVGNEFSDHRMEKQSYLYLAPSKLRQCSIGPELLIGPAAFDHIPGTVRVRRGQAVLWSSDIWTGETNMSHSVANLEHHHFKYDSHRQPGDVHIHFFGADAFSFGAGIALEDADVMEVSFPPFGKPLQNPIRIAPKPEELLTVRQL